MLNKFFKINIFLLLFSVKIVQAQEINYDNRNYHNSFVVASFGRGFIEDTYFLVAEQGTNMSKKIEDIRHESIESAFGEKISFKNWYKNKYNWIDSKFLWFTQVEKNTAILWGVTTGEKGEKYTIQPSLYLGFLEKYELSKNSDISLQLVFQLGGKLKEKVCIADYGEIGGIQKVNCRLAATELAPKETLKYLFNEYPKNHQFMFKYNLIF